MELATTDWMAMQTHGDCGVATCSNDISTPNHPASSDSMTRITLEPRFFGPLVQLARLPKSKSCSSLVKP